MSESAASELCTACGMCCDGTLFQFARVSKRKSPSELTSLGLVLTHADAEAEYFAQPCPALVNRCCTVYERRPSVCVGYRCRLLRRLDADEITVDEALSVVASTTKLRDGVVARIRAITGRDDTLSLRELTVKLHEAWEADPSGNADIELRMDLAMLSLQLQRQFRFVPEEQKPAMGEDAPAV